MADALDVVRVSAGEGSQPEMQPEMDVATRLPAVLAGLNAICAVLLCSAWLAIRRGNRERHRQLMLVNLGVTALFLIAYGSQMALVGHTGAFPAMIGCGPSSC